MLDGGKSMAGLCALSHYYKLWGDIESIRDFDVCFSVDTGWNTVEEHIPVLYYIKSHYKNAKILTILLEDNTMEMIREHSDLWEQLQECSDIILYNSFPYSNFAHGKWPMCLIESACWPQKISTSCTLT